MLSGSVGRALDLGSNGCQLETHRQQSHHVAFLSKTLYPQLITGLTHEDRNRPDMTENC